METLKIGNPAPYFRLPGVDSTGYSLEDFKDREIIIVMFSCNNCPTVKAYEDRFIQLQDDHKDKGVTLIAINGNDGTRYREDSFENMKIRAREKEFNFPLS